MIALSEVVAEPENPRVILLISLVLVSTAPVQSTAAGGASGNIVGVCCDASGNSVHVQVVASPSCLHRSFFSIVLPFCAYAVTSYTNAMIRSIEPRFSLQLLLTARNFRPTWVFSSSNLIFPHLTSLFAGSSLAFILWPLCAFADTNVQETLVFCFACLLLPSFLSLSPRIGSVDW